MFQQILEEIKHSYFVEAFGYKEVKMCAILVHPTRYEISKKSEN